MLHPHAIEATAAQGLQCPRCGLPATITDRFMLYGSPGPVEHVTLACVAGHWFTPPVESLPNWLDEPHGVDTTHLRTPANAGGSP